jgi:hypothetical protein
MASSIRSALGDLSAFSNLSIAGDREEPAVGEAGDKQPAAAEVASTKKFQSASTKRRWAKLGQKIKAALHKTEDALASVSADIRKEALLVLDREDSQPQLLPSPDAKEAKDTKSASKKNKIKNQVRVHVFALQVKGTIRKHTRRGGGGQGVRICN